LSNEEESFEFSEGWITTGLPILPDGQNYFIKEHSFICSGKQVSFKNFTFRGQPPPEVNKAE